LNPKSEEMKIRNSVLASAGQFVINILLVYLVYEICRFAYLFQNWDELKEGLSLGEMLKGGFMFDTAAILYTNVLYALLILLPIHIKENKIYRKVAKWLFVVVNGVAVLANLTDAVYFRYTGRRSTITIFSEFSNEDNLFRILGVEIYRNWYLVLLFILLVYFLWRFYCEKVDDKYSRAWLEKSYRIKYYLTNAVCFLLFVPLCICGMRGGATAATRPITISNANQYADRPIQAAAVLNTPFALLRTIGKKVFVVPDYFTPEELDAIYSPVHVPADTVTVKKKNVVVLIVESFGREYIGEYNRWLDDGKFKGYTPFVDSLIQHSTTYLYSYCNGRKSIDAMPSILSSVPMFIEPYFLTPSSTNDLSGLAGELKNKGYYSAFFHGAENGSMGFQAFARTIGFDDYFGRTEYDSDSRFDGDKDFDGTWAIWDEPFLQFYAQKMNEMPQPFITTVFTASSHHPFVVPDKYKSVFKEEGHMINKCIRYTDNALRQFFATASKMPWFNNTLFVITSDHANQSAYEYYNTDLGWFCSPIIFYDPSGELKPGMRDAIAQQIDILPTVLGYLGYDKPFISFGCDLFKTPAKDTWAVNYCNDVYQYVKGDYVLQWDGTKTKAIYNFRTDLLLQNNLLGKVPQQDEMEKEVKAIIQSYMTRMTTNSLICK
jgi:phosphoglycerol transferase MdoB-like AlkP superfamily enzyme